MAEKRRYNSKINAKGLENSVSEEQAGVMCRNQGNRYVFIVEAHAGPKTVDEDGSETVSLIPDLVELVPGEQEERVRTFMRALYIARPDQFGQAAFDGASPGEIPLEAAAADLDALVEKGDDGQPTGIWSPECPAADPCPFPDCTLVEGHESDHLLPGEPAEAEGQVVAFSGKGKS